MVKIGHASADERGTYRNGTAGDQTGREVCVRSWYNRPWNVLLRPKSPEKALRIRKAALEACENPNIGYDQNQRTTLYEKAKAAGWRIADIRDRCETDCSALVAVCVNAAGIPVSKDIYTGNMVNALLSTGEFDAYGGKRYLDNDKYLREGDILVYEGHHTAVVLDPGACEKALAGWKKDGNGWWYLNQDGSFPKMRWEIINGHYYLFGASGYMLTGWVQWDGKKTGAGKWYYLEEQGDYEGALWHESEAGDGSLERWNL